MMMMMMTTIVIIVIILLLFRPYVARYECTRNRVKSVLSRTTSSMPQRLATDDRNRMNERLHIKAV